MTIELDTTLAQAEVLFLSFSQLVADIDRRQAERDVAAGPGTEGLRRRTNVPTSSSGESTTASSPSGSSDALSGVDMPVISEYLRELLDNGHTTTNHS